MDSCLPDFDSLWDFDRPAETREKFLSLVPAAEIEADRSGDARYLAELLTQIARTHSLQRDFESAHAVLDDAKSLETPAARVGIRLLLERGRAFNSAGRASEAGPLFREAWDLAREAREDALAVDAAHMVAIVESDDEALRWNTLALEHATASADPKARRWRKSLHNNLGWTYFSMGETARALAHFESCLACSIELDDPVSARIARWSIGKALRVLGRVDEALARQRVLLAEIEAADGDPGYACEEIAECLLAQESAQEARPFFARAFASLSTDPWLAEREPDRLARLRELS